MKIIGIIGFTMSILSVNVFAEIHPWDIRFPKDVKSCQVLEDFQKKIGPEVKGKLGSDANLNINGGMVWLEYRCLGEVSGILQCREPGSRCMEAIGKIAKSEKIPIDEWNNVPIGVLISALPSQQEIESYIKSMLNNRSASQEQKKNEPKAEKKAAEQQKKSPTRADYEDACNKGPKPRKGEPSIFGMAVGVTDFQFASACFLSHDVTIKTVGNLCANRVYTDGSEQCVENPEAYVAKITGLPMDGLKLASFLFFKGTLFHVSYEIDQNYDMSKLLLAAKEKYGKPIMDGSFNGAFDGSATWKKGNVEIVLKKSFMGSHEMAFTDNKIATARVASDRRVMESLGKKKAIETKAF